MRGSHFCLYFYIKLQIKAPLIVSTTDIYIYKVVFYVFMGIFDAIKPRKQMTSMFITDVDKEYCRKNGLKLTAVFHMGVEAHRQGNNTLITKVQRMAELLHEQSRRIYTLEHDAKQRGDK